MLKLKLYFSILVTILLIILYSFVVCLPFPLRLPSSKAIKPFTIQLISKKLKFNKDLDLVSLHYDFAADPDDGHSAAADRVVLEKKFGQEWIKTHVLAISGTCGIQCSIFNYGSHRVMKKIWNNKWLFALKNKKRNIRLVSNVWKDVITAGGKIYVKEGGQSNFTALVLNKLSKKLGRKAIKRNIIVVQHSKWNEDHTSKEALAVVKQKATYIKIPDANSYLKKNKGDVDFIEAASKNKYWKVAFKFLNPYVKLDFSDTGELLYILGYKNMSIDKYRRLFLDD